MGEFKSTNNYIKAVNDYQNKQNGRSQLKPMQNAYKIADLFGDVSYSGREMNYGREIANQFGNKYAENFIGPRAAGAPTELPKWVTDLGYDANHDFSNLANSPKTEGLFGHLKNNFNPNAAQTELSQLGAEGMIQGPDKIGIGQGAGQDGIAGSRGAQGLMALMLLAQQIGKDGSWASKNLKIR